MDKINNQMVKGGWKIFDKLSAKVYLQRGIIKTGVLSTYSEIYTE